MKNILLAMLFAIITVGCATDTLVEKYEELTNSSETVAVSKPKKELSNKKEIKEHQQSNKTRLSNPKHVAKLSTIMDDLDSFAKDIYESKSYFCSDYSIKDYHLGHDLYINIDSYEPIVGTKKIFTKDRISQIMIDSKEIKNNIRLALGECNKLTKKMDFIKRGVN